MGNWPAAVSADTGCPALGIAWLNERRWTSSSHPTWFGPVWGTSLSRKWLRCHEMRREIRRESRRRVKLMMLYHKRQRGSRGACLYRYGNREPSLRGSKRGTKWNARWISHLDFYSHNLWKRCNNRLLHVVLKIIKIVPSSNQVVVAYLRMM